MKLFTCLILGRGLEIEVSRSFIEGVSWPVDRASVVALSDLGLSPQQIARYFSVTPEEVSRLMDAAVDQNEAAALD
jgi:CRP-like cAMP-binding protein